MEEVEREKYCPNSNHFILKSRTRGLFFTLVKSMYLQMKSSDAKASKRHLKFSNCHLSEITEPTHRSLIIMIILEEHFRRHLEAFASELFKCS